MRPPTVDVEKSLSKPGSDIYNIKIGSERFEVNIAIPVGQAKKLKQVFSTPWEPGSIRLGRSAGSAVFWSCDKRTVSILIGHDDETWDVGFSIPLATLKAIIREIEKCADAPD